MSRLEEKSNNEIQLDIKQLELEHEALKTAMLKDYDSIEFLKEKIKKDFRSMEDVEQRFNEAAKLITQRLKGEV